MTPLAAYIVFVVALFVGWSLFNDGGFDPPKPAF